MFVEMHILQNFAPSNLNRDDTGAPKDCEFGGYRRARISSQCLKRAISKESCFTRVMEGQGAAIRTRRLIVEIAERLSDRRPALDKHVEMVSKVFAEGGIERPQDTKNETEKDNTKLLLFMDSTAIDEMAEVFRSRWNDLISNSKESRSEAVEALGAILAESVKAPSIALFGRMIEVKNSTPFGKKNLGVDGSCQVAHAISTNKVNMEFDFFTAVDDLLPKGDTGAGMMDTVQFNSSCFYRYANVDMTQLKANLAGDGLVAVKTLRAFLEASVAAIPTGKQNSMAAHNPPSLVFLVTRQFSLWNLANAFLKPVQPDLYHDLAYNSAVELDKYWEQLTRMYGEDGIVGTWVCALDSDTGLAHFKEKRALVPSVRDAIEGAVTSVKFA